MQVMVLSQKIALATSELLDQNGLRMGCEAFGPTMLQVNSQLIRDGVQDSLYVSPHWICLAFPYSLQSPMLKVASVVVSKQRLGRISIRLLLVKLSSSPMCRSTALELGL
jgi:hypothetical protein